MKNRGPTVPVSVLKIAWFPLQQMKINQVSEGINWNQILLCCVTCPSSVTKSYLSISYYETDFLKNVPLHSLFLYLSLIITYSKFSLTLNLRLPPKCLHSVSCSKILKTRRCNIGNCTPQDGDYHVIVEFRLDNVFKRECNMKYSLPLHNNQTSF